MNKKRLFAILLFIVLGLFMFTFANPKNNNESKKPNGDIISPVKENVESTVDNTDSLIQDKASNDSIILTPTAKTIVIVKPTNNNDNKNNEIGDVIVDSFLDDAKKAAREELANYKKDYQFDKENKSIADNIKSEGKDDIDKATSKEEIEKVLEEAKDSIDKLIDEDLNAYKEKAKEAVKEYTEELNFTNDVIDIIDGIDEAIDNAKTKNEIDKIVDEAKDLLKDLKELEFAKENAIEELEKYRNDYIYSEKNKTKHDKIVSNGKNNINDAKTVEEVYERLKEAEKKIDKLIKKDLKEAKIDAKKVIDEYNAKELYNDNNTKKVNNIKVKAKKAIDKAKSRNEINKIVEKAKKDIDKIKKLTDTEFTVIFKGLNGEVLKEQGVLYNTTAEAPAIDDINDRGITYEFKGWDKDFSHIKENTTVTAKYDITKIIAKMYALNEGIKIPENGGNAGTSNYKSIGKIALDINNEKVLKAIGDTTQNITLDETEIKSIVAEELPLLNKMNYKYKFYVLKFEKGDGFHIDAAIVEDQEQIAQNTVTITYKINENDDAIFGDGTRTIVSTEIIKYNIVKLPEVYKNNKEVNVIWMEENTNNIVEDNTRYEHSVTLVATVDKTAPVITLNGATNRNLFEQNGVYEEEGFEVSDSYNELTKENVNITITRDNEKVESVDYSIPGKYVITYTVVDRAGNTASVTRTIDVKEVLLDHIELSRTSGSYFVGDQDDTNNITVKAFYNDSTRNRVLGEDEFTKDKKFDSSTSGTNTITFSYEGKTATYTYTVKDIVLESLKLSSSFGKYIVGDKIENISVILHYNNGHEEELKDVCEDIYYLAWKETKCHKAFNVTGFSTDINNVGTGKTAIIEYNGVKAEYKYDLKYKAEIGANWLELGHYLKFELPSNVYVESITRYDENGTSHDIKFREYLSNLKYIDENEYLELQKMDGTNPNRKMVVKFSNGIELFYSKVEKN